MPSIAAGQHPHARRGENNVDKAHKQPRNADAQCIHSSLDDMTCGEVFPFHQYAHDSTTTSQCHWTVCNAFSTICSNAMPIEASVVDLRSYFPAQWIWWRSAKEWGKKSVLIYCNRWKRMTPCSQKHSPVWSGRNGNSAKNRRSLRSPHWRHSWSIFVSNTLSSNAQQQSQKKIWIIRWKRTREAFSSILFSQVVVLIRLINSAAMSASTEMQEICHTFN